MRTTTKKQSRANRRLKFENMVSDTILPYKEKPAGNKHVNPESDELTAQDLFSRFTADIIKENVVFKR